MYEAVPEIIGKLVNLVKTRANFVDNWQSTNMQGLLSRVCSGIILV